jgi:putative flippase GtrA
MGRTADAIDCQLMLVQFRDRLLQSPISNQFNNLRQFVRFLLVGGLNTAFGYTLFGAIYLLTGRPGLSVVTATIFGVVFNFFSTGRLVFAYRGVLTFVPFVLGYAVICLINVVALGLLTAQGLHPLLGQLIVLPLCVLLSFGINRYIFLQRAP